MKVAMVALLQIQKGKYHGMIDIGLAVITYKSGGFHMDIDAEEQVYHVKVFTTFKRIDDTH